MMAEIMMIIVTVLWIVAGIVVLVGMVRWNKRFSKLYDELKNKIEENQNG